MKAQGMPWMNKASNLVWYSHWGSVPVTITLAVDSISHSHPHWSPIRAHAQILQLTAFRFKREMGYRFQASQLH